MTAFLAPYMPVISLVVLAVVVAIGFIKKVNVWEPGVYGWSKYVEPVAVSEDAGAAPVLNVPQETQETTKTPAKRSRK